MKRLFVPLVVAVLSGYLVSFGCTACAHKTPVSGAIGATGVDGEPGILCVDNAGNTISVRRTWAECKKTCSKHLHCQLGTDRGVTYNDDGTYNLAPGGVHTSVIQVGQ